MLLRRIRHYLSISLTLACGCAYASSYEDLSMQLRFGDPFDVVEQCQDSKRLDCRLALADAYYHGLGVRTVHYEALYLYEQVAKVNSYLESPYAAYMTAKLYNERGREEDAAPYFQFAADDGNPTAMSLLGMYYVEGKGIKADLSKGLGYLKLASERGSTLGQFFYAFYALNGLHQKLTLEQAETQVLAAFEPAGINKGDWPEVPDIALNAHRFKDAVAFSQIRTSSNIAAMGPFSTNTYKFYRGKMRTVAKQSGFELSDSGLDSDTFAHPNPQGGPTTIEAYYVQQDGSELTHGSPTDLLHRSVTIFENMDQAGFIHIKQMFSDRYGKAQRDSNTEASWSDSAVTIRIGFNEDKQEIWLEFTAQDTSQPYPSLQYD